jgi:hypothetical protein
MDPVADGNDEQDAAQAFEKSPVQVDVILPLVVKGKKSGKTGCEQKSRRDQPMQGFMNFEPVLLADRRQQVGAEQVPLDHEKKHEKPEQVHGLHPADRAGAFGFPIAPFHGCLPRNGTCKKNKNQPRFCKKKPGNLLWAMSKHFLVGQRKTDLQAKDGIGIMKLTQEEINGHEEQ